MEAEVVTTILKVIAKEGFLAILVVFLLYRLFKKENALLDAYRDGADTAGKVMEGLDKVRIALTDLREEVRRR